MNIRLVRVDRCPSNGTTRNLFGYCHLPALALALATLERPSVVTCLACTRWDTLKGFEKNLSIFRNVDFLVAFMTGVTYYFELEIEIQGFIFGGIWQVLVTFFITCQNLCLESPFDFSRSVDFLDSFNLQARVT